MFSLLCLIAFGANSCFDRLYPSGITADTEYSSTYPAENLIDDRYNTYWHSANGDVNDYVYIDFSNDVDIMHIMVREGTYYVTYIGVDDGITGQSMTYTNYDDVEDYKIWNFWFSEFITSRVRIYFYGSQSSFIRVSTISFWGCNMTITAVPTISPTKMPTNSTPTVHPTILPSVSPSQMPTNSSPSIQPTFLPTRSPSMPPSILPTSSPSMSPTTTLVPSTSPTMTPTSSLLPTTSPTVPPTWESTGSSNEGTVTTGSDVDSFFTIGAVELLGVFVIILLITLVCMCVKHHQSMKKFESVNLIQMHETHDLPDKL